MLRSRLILYVLAIAMLGVPSPTIAGGSDDLVAVSMAQLITRPGPYVGKRIEVVGYLGIDGDLYLSRDHAEAHDAMSSIAVSDTDEGEIAAAGCTGSYVRIRGSLVELDTGRPIISNVIRVFLPIVGKECWSAS